MSSNPRLSKKVLSLGALVALVSPACVHQAAPGVRISALQASIVFGVKLPNKDITPPGAAPTTDVAATADLGLPPQLPDTPSTKPSSPALPTIPRVSCPPARQDAFPEAPATDSVTKTPEAGSYLWQQLGSTNINSFVLPFNPFGHRQISDVSAITTTHYPAGDPIDPTRPVDETEFTYTVRRPDLLSAPNGNGGYFIDTFQVRQTPASQNTSTYAGPVVGAGDPERGLALKRTDRYDRNGNPLGSFAPSPGVLLLPLPVITAQQFQSVGVDPVSGATMVVNGIVGSRKQIDACGTVIEGWEVPTTVSYTSPDGAQSSTTYTFDVATQLGAILIFEKYEASTAPSASTIPNQTFTIGQLHPGTATK